MSSLLAFDIVTTDLKELELNLKKEVTDKFSNVVWDEKPFETEVNWKTYYKLYGAGETTKTKSTRRCLDQDQSTDAIGFRCAMDRMGAPSSDLRENQRRGTDYSKKKMGSNRR